MPRAPKLIKPLASLSPSSFVKPAVEEKGVSSKQNDESAPHYFDHTFIVEHLAENPVVGDVRALLIPASITEVVEQLTDNFKNVCADLNAAIHERNEVDAQMKKGILRVSHQGT